MKIELSHEEVHLLVSWGYTIRSNDGESFTVDERQLLEKLKAHRRKLEGDKRTRLEDVDWDALAEKMAAIQEDVQKKMAEAFRTVVKAAKAAEEELKKNDH